jgi:hypothetical protein
MIPRYPQTVFGPTKTRVRRPMPRRTRTALSTECVLLGKSFPDMKRDFLKRLEDPAGTGWNKNFIL